MELREGANKNNILLTHPPLISLHLLNQWMDFYKWRVIFGQFFMANPMVRSLYTSADMKKDNFITSDPVDGFQSVRGHFGVVFHGQSNGEVTVHISSHGRRHLCNILSSVWMSTCQGSIQGNFFKVLPFLIKVLIKTKEKRVFQVKMSQFYWKKP